MARTCGYCGYPLSPLFHDFPCQPMRPELDGVMQARANLVLEARPITRPAAPEAPQGPTPPASFPNVPLIDQGGREAAEQP